MAEQWYADRGQWVRATRDALSLLEESTRLGAGGPDPSAQVDLIVHLADHLLPGQASILRGAVEKAILPRHLLRRVHAALDAAEGRPPPRSLQVGGLVVDRLVGEGLVAWLSTPLLGASAALCPVVDARSLGALTRVLGNALSLVVGPATRLAPADVHRLVESVQVLLPPHAVPRVVGPSLDLAVALHLWTRLTAIARSRRVLVMGKLAEDGEVHGVGGVDLKVLAALDEAPELDALVVPEADLEEVQALLAGRPGAPSVIAIAHFDQAVELLGQLSVWPELALVAEEAEASRDDRRKQQVAALIERRLGALPADAPDPTWAPAVLWLSRLLPRQAGADRLAGHLREAIAALRDGGPVVPATGTSPEDLAELAAEQVVSAHLSMEWSRGRAVVDGLACLPDARALWPELWPSPAPPPASPEHTWLRRRVAVGTCRLYAALGHHDLHLDLLDPAERLLRSALPEAPAAERGRLLLHLARVGLRRGDPEGLRGWLQLVEQAGALPAARASRVVDRTEVNAAIVRYQAETLRQQLAGLGGAFTPCTLPEGLALHHHDLLVRDLAECGRAWACGDAHAWQRVWARLDAQRGDSTLLGMLLDGLALLGSHSSAPSLAALARPHAPDLEPWLATHRPALSAHSSLADPDAVARSPLLLWRLPYLDPLFPISG
ncbi:hypothetical protein L6R53_00770 [Myxococcota bacterium]|nr:hypothetical protein [Myxococcota bacterium]